MRQFRDYDPFARLYAEYWGAEFHRAILPVLDRTLLSDLPRGAAILDLCCGDGRLTAKLKQRGFSVTGLDSSEQMLSYARQRCADIPFLRGDARQFHLPARFDAVISTFDSLNHVMTPRDLTRVFSSVHGCLKKNGRFLFDLNREEAYRELWSREMSTIDDRVVSVARGSFSPEKRIAVCDITAMFLDDGQWRRTDFQMRQRFHARASVLAALQRCNFNAEVYLAQDLGMAGGIGYGREIYVARKITRRSTARGRKHKL